MESRPSGLRPYNDEDDDNDENDDNRQNILRLSRQYCEADTARSADT
ncbi:MAG: hypothetical protein K2K75_01705 [Muribaculaceae bacterium]|nr:hypothetical protein [Muribaculaceae bacterium]